MSHARVEEVSDSDLGSDPSEGDISDLDAEDFDEREIIKQRAPIPQSQSKPSQAQASHINPSQIPAGFQPPSVDASKYKHLQCIYPVYFDKNKSRAEGRRVGLEQAVESPLAASIVAACGMLRLDTVFEPNKIHPKDWANPGRVKVRVKGSGGSVKNKHQLYSLISKYLLANPTTSKKALEPRIPGFPMPDSAKPYPKPSIPKGWKINMTLPYYSSALTGGGVSENFLGNMMSEMQNAGQSLPAGMPDMSALASMMGGGGGGGPAPAIEGSKKKEKKIKGKK